MARPSLAVVVSKASDGQGCAALCLHLGHPRADRYGPQKAVLMSSFSEANLRPSAHALALVA